MASIAMKRPPNLREILTTSSTKELNDARKSGDSVVIRKYKQNPRLMDKLLLLQNTQTGEIIEAPSRNYIRQYGEQVFFSRREWKLIFKFSSYSRRNPPSKDWAAYIVPKETKVGENVFISRLIEDLVACEFWSSRYAAESAIATWDGKDLIIDHNSYKAHLVG